MKQIHLNQLRQGLIASAMVGVVGLTSGSALAAPVTAKDATTTPSASPNASQQQHLTNLKTRGDAEIQRRLVTLNSLSGVITGASHLTASDKAYLTTEVTTEVSGLTALETQLNGETTVTAGQQDVQSIYSEFRVYALIDPKVRLVRTADDQQAAESKLSTLATKLQARITADQTAGKDVTSLQATLTNMDTVVSDSTTISGPMEQTVLTLQPADYNSDHTLLSGDAAQLKTAHTDNVTASADAKTIVSGLKSIK